MDVQELLYQMFMEKCTKSLSESRPDCLEGTPTDMDEERLLAMSVQHMGCREKESHSQQMIEKYVGEEEQPQLEPKAFGAPKKGHVYGFKHSMDTSKVLSGASSSGSQATSAFSTPGAPGALCSTLDCMDRNPRRPVQVLELGPRL
ncbi:hypothetical protein Taro_017551 [Colocasia esculenta]|uniref:Uncharacterized protein n=1 Tax=Colocasia esculenta TaxID=4460 RepID=A0A843UTL3_COLES|nr:hypothetical protein [Colocasia esculenta]